MKELHFSESFINPEDVEALSCISSDVLSRLLCSAVQLLIHVLPTAEESKKLLAWLASLVPGVFFIRKVNVRCSACCHARLEYKDRVADLRDVG